MPEGGNQFDDICIRLDTLPDCDRQTDRRTDRFANTVSRSAFTTCWRATKSRHFLT